MSIFTRILEDLRERSRTREAEQRDLRRREQQAVTDGFLRSGEPTPIPVYPGQSPEPLEGTPRKVGYDKEQNIGNGGVLTLTIHAADAGLPVVPNPHRSWTWLAMYRTLTATGANDRITENWTLFAHDEEAGLSGRPIWGAASTSARTLVYSSRLTAAVVQLKILVSNANYTYTLCGYWEEDR